MAKAGPGDDMVKLKDGEYEKHLGSINSGNKSHPIRIVGSRDVVINAETPLTATGGCPDLSLLYSSRCTYYFRVKTW